MLLSVHSLVVSVSLLLSIASASPYPSLPLYNTTSPTATTLNGTYTGVHSPTYNQDFFLGIPYAQAPLSALRFHSPVSRNSTWTSPKPATSYYPGCIGYGSDELKYASLSEDCLALNIIRPALSQNNTDLLPVVFWIYGGGFYSDAASDARYNLSFIVNTSVAMGKPIIGVSVNYRLSAWGFLWGKEVKEAGAGNLGLRDQRLALQWIQENVEGFGGDPDKVTIWGESAGAISVGYHYLAYSGRDDNLFRAGILESGGPAVKWPYAFTNPSSLTQQLYDNITEAARCTNTNDSLSCLRSTPYSTLNSIFNVSSNGLVPMIPVIDNDFVTELGSIQIANKNFVKRPILLGSNSDEGTVLTGSIIVNNDADFLESVILGGPDLATAQTLAIHYPNINAIGIPEAYNPPVNDSLGAQYKRAATYFGDAVEHSPRRTTSIAFSEEGLDVWSYRFNVVPNGYSVSTGATHASEVAFAFGNIEGNGIAINSFGGVESERLLEVSDLMTRMWVSFIHDGDPNNHGLQGYPSWPTYTTSTNNPGSNFVFDSNVTSYVESDTWRAAGIKYISEIAATQFQR